jgi:hypothetical protein
MLVMIEHISKWIKLASLWDKLSNEGVAFAFLDWVLSRYGALVKVLIA